MNYNKIEEIPEYTLAYGVRNEQGRVTFALLVKNEFNNIGYDAYVMDNIGRDINITVSELEKEFYKDEENFSIPSFVFKLNKREGKFISNEHVRLFYNEEHMTPFENKIFELLKKSYFYCNKSDNPILLYPGHIGIDKDCRMFLYLGEINNFTIRMDNIGSKSYGSNNKESNLLYKINHERYDELIERNTLSYVDEIREDNHHVYIEINNSYLNKEVFNFNYDISNISWNDLKRMFVNIHIKKERMRLMASYNGSIRSEVWRSPKTNILFEGLIKGSFYNGNWWEMIDELFSVDEDVKGARLIDAKREVTIDDGTLGIENIKIRKHETGFRRIKIIKNMEEGE